MGLEDLNIVKAEFGKEEKLHLKLYHVDPRSTLTNASSLKEKWRQGLKQVFPDAVALQFLPSSNGPHIPEASVADYISCDATVEQCETVCPMYIYTRKEYAGVLKVWRTLPKISVVMVNWWKSLLTFWT